MQCNVVILGKLLDTLLRNSLLIMAPDWLEIRVLSQYMQALDVKAGKQVRSQLRRRYRDSEARFGFAGEGGPRR